MLQAIVGDNNIDVGEFGQQRLSGFGAGRVYGDGGLCRTGYQGGFVSESRRIQLALANTCVFANCYSVAATDHARYPAALPELFNQLHDDGCLARSTNIDIADNYNRNRALPYPFRVLTVPPFFTGNE